MIGPAVQRSVPAESAPPTSPVALDINGDVNTIAASSTEVQAPDGSGAITVSTNGDSLANVAAVPSSAVLTDIPDDVDLSYGVLSFTSPVAPGGTAIFDVTFPEPLPLDVEWYKVRDGVWTAHPDVVRVDDFTLRISIVDGSTADDDRTVNGYVTDPGYLGTSASTEVLEAFAAPISTTGMNVTKAKSSTPVKWRLLREGVAVTDPAHFVGLSSAPGGPGCSPSLGDAVFVDPGGLAYVKGFWKLTWKAPATKGCYTLTLHVAGQQPVSATFTVR